MTSVRTATAAYKASVTTGWLPGRPLIHRGAMLVSMVKSLDKIQGDSYNCEWQAGNALDALRAKLAINAGIICVRA